MLRQFCIVCLVPLLTVSSIPLARHKSCRPTTVRKEDPTFAPPRIARLHVDVNSWLTCHAYHEEERIEHCCF